MKQGAIYLRVSSIDQDYKRQEIELKALAQSMGYEVKPEHVFEEKASAVLQADTREELTKMRTLTRDDVERIFIWDITRLSRRANDFIALVNEFNDKGICLHFKDKNIITLDEDGKVNVLTQLYMYILGTFAQLDAENLKAKFRSGKINGYLNGTSHTQIAPFGYKMVNKQLVIDEKNAKWVRFIYDSYLSGKSLSQIIDTLSAKRVASVRGKKWTKISLAQVLKNPTYKGEGMVCVRTRDINRNIIDKKEIPSPCPVIIDAATWEKAQLQREKNRHDVDKTKKTEALLRGILKCGNCGSSYIVMQSSQYNLKQYVCCDKYKGANTKVNCKNGSIKVNTIDSIVWDCIKDVYRYKRFKDSFKLEQEKAQSQLDDNNRQIENIQADIKDLDKKADKVNKGYINGIFNDDDAYKMKHDISNEKARLEKQISTLQGENLNLASKLNQDFSNYKLPEKELTREEKKVVFNEQIESARMYSFGKTKRVVNLKLKVGITYNICTISARHTNYFVVEDSIVHFDTDCLKDGWNGDLFTIHDKKQVLFKDGTSGAFDFDGMWQVMTEHNLIVNLK